jgi:hypothetical protein
MREVNGKSFLATASDGKQIFPKACSLRLEVSDSV